MFDAKFWSGLGLLGFDVRCLLTQALREVRWATEKEIQRWFPRGPFNSMKWLTVADVFSDCVYRWLHANAHQQSRRVRQSCQCQLVYTRQTERRTHVRFEYCDSLTLCWLFIRFPCVLPFSQMYPLCCIDIRNFLNQFYFFSDDHFQQPNVIDETLKKVRAP